MSTFTVTDTLDDGSIGSLPWAITQVNQDTTDTSANPDTIDFDINGTGIQTIELSSVLPQITQPVVIDGGSQSGQPGYSGSPLVSINGSNLPSSSSILSVTDGWTTIDGLAIVGAPGAGILLTGSSNNLVQDCYVGTLDGNASSANDEGIQLVGASNNTISGNLISGNTQDGIDLTSSSSGELIQKNIIGLNAAGAGLLANGGDGVDQNGSPNNTIGGIAGVTGNIISGNGGDGIYLGTGNDTLVEGNDIGTNLSGTAALGNGQVGILFANASYTTIGGTVAGTGNLISGNHGSGIDCFVIGSGNELIEGNFVGVDVTGKLALGNGNQGIRIAGPVDCTVGGTTAAAANVIGANAADGINLTIGSANGTVIEGNFIGTDKSGTIRLGNQDCGILLGSDQVTIGGTAAQDGNVIANNYRAGIQFQGGLDEVSILSNSIYGNGNLGINFGSGPTANHLDEQGVSGGPNNYQNYPVLSSAATQGTSTTVVGSLNAGADTTYLLQFFGSPAPDPSGYGQGQVYLGSTTVTTGSNSDANDVNFNVTLPTALSPGWVVSATATDPIGDTSEFSQDVPIEPEGNVGVSIAASPTTGVYAGSTLTYTVTITSNGPEPANNVVVTDDLPAAITANVLASCSIPGVTPVIGTDVVTAALGTLAVNATATLTIMVQPTAAAVPQITDDASVTTTDFQTNSGNDSAQITTTVAPTADLAVTIDETPDPGYVGSPLSYILNVTNNGPSSATNVVVTDTLPQGIVSNVTTSTTFAGLSPVVANGVVTADFSSLAAGATGTITISFPPLPVSVPQMTDNATITSGTFDPNPSNDSASVTTPVDGVTDLVVGITASASTAPIGQDVTYTIAATNNGPSDATGVVVTDDLASGVSFVSATGGALPSSGVLTFDVGDLPATSSATYEVTVQSSASTASPMDDQVSISGDQYDPIPTNNTAKSTISLVPSSILSIAMTGLPNPVKVGSDLTYSLTATNSGQVADPDAIVYDTLPADVTFVSASEGATPVNGVVTFDLGEFAVNASQQFTIVVQPTAAATAGSLSGTITNSAVIQGQDNGNPNNSASTTTTVDAVTGLALQLTTTQSQGYVGEPLIYTITATNTGPSEATNLIVSDALPSDITSDVSATTSIADVNPTIADGRVTATFGDLALGATVTMTIVVIPSAAASSSSPLNDNAYISDDEIDSDNGTATVSTPIAAGVDLDITQFTAGASSIEFGDDLTYTAVITNNGPSPATGVTLTAPMGNSATFVSGSFTNGSSSSTPVGQVTQSGSNLVAAIGNLAVGASETVTFVIAPGSGAIGTFVTSVTASSNQYDLDPASSTAQTTTTVLGRPGTIQFSALTYQVTDTAGSATITLVRTDGSTGQVSVDFSTYAVSATAGLDYQPTSGTIVFPAGATSETIQVPVLADPYGAAGELVGLSISNPTGGAALASTSTATLTIVDVNPNTTLPQVTGLQWTGSSASIVSLILTFNEPLAAGPANTASDYTLVNIGADGIFGTGDDSTVPIIVASYNPSNWTVTLMPAAPLSVNQFYHIAVNGSSPGGITNLAGTELAGAGPSLAGTNYTALFAQGTKLTYVDTSQNKVTLTIKKGGYLDDVLTGANQTGELVVVGEVPRHTVISGTIKKRKHGPAQPPLSYTVYGVGKIGNVRVKLKSSQFHVTQNPTSPSLAISRSTPADTRLENAATASKLITSARPRAIKRVDVRGSRMISSGTTVEVAGRSGRE
ncbi:MAG: beta strand repeat-containing protein [Isosphaeraceae bacterium]